MAKRSKIEHVDDFLMMFAKSIGFRSDNYLMKKRSKLKLTGSSMNLQIGTIEDPLIWWKDNASKFTFLNRLARKMLCIPASSVPSERIFSTAGLILSKQRAGLSPDIADKFIFLNKNMKF